MFPLSEVATYLESSGARIEPGQNSFTWAPEPSSRATFAALPLHRDLGDGFVVTEQAEWVLRAPWMEGIDDATLNDWNLFASVAGFAHYPGSGELVLTSKVGIYSQDGAAASRNYAPIMATAAAGLGWIAERFARSDFEVSPHACPFHRVDHPPPVGPEEFASVLKTHIDRMGVLGSAGTESLSAEFPWDEGALTAMARLPDLRASLMSATGYSSAQADRAAGRTALMLLRSDLHHPWFGRGIFSTLELPIGGDLPTLLALVRELNQWELETPELPPFFGAWVVGPRAPMFQTFVPNQLCVPGIVMNLAVWAASRARMVREWLAEEGTRH